jgi:hypothetical protein
MLYSSEYLFSNSFSITTTTIDHCGQPVSLGWFGLVVWFGCSELFLPHKRYLNAIISRVQDIYNSVFTIMREENAGCVNKINTVYSLFVLIYHKPYNNPFICAYTVFM